MLHRLQIATSTSGVCSVAITKMLMLLMLPMLLMLLRLLLMSPAPSLWAPSKPFYLSALIVTWFSWVSKGHRHYGY
jgi:hypothetical protein